jgi:acetylornithine/succinyldiaminopimelate/putrescine aminotransferase
MWAVEHEGVEPDLMTSAKGIASGVPMGALIARAEVLDAWPPGAHGNTFGGNPLAIAAANSCSSASASTSRRRLPGMSSTSVDGA